MVNQNERNQEALDLQKYIESKAKAEADNLKAQEQLKATFK